jgi:hypothetical protein
MALWNTIQTPQSENDKWIYLFEQDMHLFKNLLAIVVLTYEDFLFKQTIYLRKVSDDTNEKQRIW